MAISISVKFAPMGEKFVRKLVFFDLLILFIQASVIKGLTGHQPSAFSLQYTPELRG